MLSKAYISSRSGCVPGGPPAPSKGVSPPASAPGLSAGTAGSAGAGSCASQHRQADVEVRQ
eukprot:3080355-Alexandrium_andersonii.AAC.1